MSFQSDPSKSVHFIDVLKSIYLGVNVTSYLENVKRSSILGYIWILNDSFAGIYPLDIAIFSSGRYKSTA